MSCRTATRCWRRPRRSRSRPPTAPRKGSMAESPTFAGRHQGPRRRHCDVLGRRQGREQPAVGRQPRRHGACSVPPARPLEMSRRCPRRTWSISLRFDGPDVLEMVGQVTGGEKIAAPKHPVKDFADAAGQHRRSLRARWRRRRGRQRAGRRSRKQVDSTPGWATRSTGRWPRPSRQYGLHLPGDLKLLFGSNLLVALDGTGLS